MLIDVDAEERQEKTGKSSKLFDSFSGWIAGLRDKVTGDSENEGLPSGQDQPESAAPEEEPQPSAMPLGCDALERLRTMYEACKGMHALPVDDSDASESPVDVPPVLYYAGYMLDGEEPPKLLRDFLDQMQNQAKALLSAPRKTAQKPEEEPDRPVPVDASCRVYLPRDKMEAWVFILPPFNQGKEIDEAGIREALGQSGVTNGIDEEILASLSNAKSYLKLARVARGRAPVNGDDGQIIDRFPREKKILLDAGENDPVNYKELNWLHSVHENDVLCELIPPTEPIPGSDVTGAPISGKAGKKAIPPMGKGTKLGPDGATLIATCEGQVCFAEGKFRVDQLTLIESNVDMSTGNINVVGDLVIGGDVREGFIVKATGNIVVKGMIEGATVIAGGSAQIKKGINGNNHGTLETKGDVFAKFIENCTVQAGGVVHADSIINSTISSNEKIDVMGGRGVVIGGTLMACRGIDAKIIGNISHRTTTLVVGSTPAFLLEKAQLSEEIRLLRKQMEDAEKNMAYISKATTVTPEYEAIRDQLKLQMTVQKMQLAKQTRKLDAMEQELADMKGCYIKCSVLYPLTQVTFGRQTHMVTTALHNCWIYYGDEGITVGVQ